MHKIACFVFLSRRIAAVVPGAAQRVGVVAAVSATADNDACARRGMPILRALVLKSAPIIIAGGLVFTGAYVDNLMVENGASPLPIETYSFLPTIGFDHKTPRQSQSLSYSAGFSLYQHQSDLNTVAQSARAVTVPASPSMRHLFSETGSNKITIL